MIEDADFRTPRGLDRALFHKLAACGWIRHSQHLLISGPTGVGKSWLACALGTQSLPRRLLGALSARAAPVRRTRHGPRRRPVRATVATLERTRLLIIDDWGPEPLTAEQRRDLMEIVDDRYEKGSLLITSQVPVRRWHEVIGEPTFGDAISIASCTALIGIDLKGPRLRRRHAEPVRRRHGRSA